MAPLLVLRSSVSAPRVTVVVVGLRAAGDDEPPLSTVVRHVGGQRGEVHGMPAAAPKVVAPETLAVRATGRTANRRSATRWR
jgi:hypothetical protein